MNIIKRFILLPLIGVIFLLASCVSGPDNGDVFSLELDDPVPVSPDVTVGTLDNGLTYYIRHNDYPEGRVELRLAVNAGSILEDDDQQGLAHFAEHMAFNGTGNFQKHEIVDYLESIGMPFGPEVNAYTSYDETVYMLTMPSDQPDVLESGIRILSEWAFRISFDPGEIDKERGVIVEEWRGGRGASARMRDQYLPVLLKDSRYAVRRPIGTMDIVRNFEDETLVSFYRDWYRPDLMAVIAVGDIDPAETESLIRTMFSSQPAPKNPRTRKEYSVPGHKDTLYSVVTDPEATSTVVRFYIKHDLDEQGYVRNYRDGIVESLYNHLLNQRLDELSREADPPFTYAYSGSGNIVRTRKVYQLVAAVQEGGVADGLDAVLTEAVRVKQHGFTESELRRGKEEILAHYRRAWDERDNAESSGFASEYIRNYLTDEVIPGIDYEYELVKKYLPGITLEEVNSVADTLIIPENRVVIVTAPEKEEASIPETKELGRIISRAESKVLEPYTEELSETPLFDREVEPGRVVSERTLDEVDGIEWVLDNGVRVALKPTTLKNREVVMSAYSPGGSSLVPDKDYVSATFAIPIVELSGLGSHSAVELNKKLAGKQVSLSPYMGSLFEGFSGESSSDDLETFFQLIHLYMTAPRKDEDAFATFQSRQLEAIMNRQSQPEAVFSDRYQQLVSRNHPRTRPMTPELFETLDHDRALEIYRDRFGDAGDFTFVFGGSFTADEIRPLVETYLGSLPAAGRQESWKDLGIRFPEQSVEEDMFMGIEPKSRVILGFGGIMPWSPEEQHTLDSLMQALDIRLREIIREDESGTYSVSIGGWMFPFPAEKYRVNVTFGCEPSRARELTETLFDVLEEAASSPLDDEYIVKVQQQQRRSYENAVQENRYWVNLIQESYLYDVPLAKMTDYESLIDGIDAEALRIMADKVLNPERHVLLTLYPEDMAE